MGEDESERTTQAEEEEKAIDWRKIDMMTWCEERAKDIYTEEERKKRNLFSKAF